MLARRDEALASERLGAPASETDAACAPPSQTVDRRRWSAFSFDGN